MKGRLWKDLCELEVAKSVPDLRDIINETDSWGNRALFKVMFKPRLETFCYFVDCGANIHIKNSIGEPLLHVLVQRGYKCCIEKLLSVGVDVNCTNEYEETPLFDCARTWACSTNSNVLRLLLSCGANVNAVSKENKTALDIMLRLHTSVLLQAPILINAGGRLCSLKKIDMDPNAIPYVEKLAACTSAKIAVRIALKKTGKVHKDVIPLIEALVFRSWEKEEWIK